MRAMPNPPDDVRPNSNRTRHSPASRNISSGSPICQSNLLDFPRPTRPALSARRLGTRVLGGDDTKPRASRQTTAIRTANGSACSRPKNWRVCVNNDGRHVVVEDIPAVCLDEDIYRIFPHVVAHASPPPETRGIPDSRNYRRSIASVGCRAARRRFSGTRGSTAGRALEAIRAAQGNCRSPRLRLEMEKAQELFIRQPENVLCAHCKANVPRTLSQEVDHIVPLLESMIRCVST